MTIRDYIIYMTSLTINNLLVIGALIKNEKHHRDELKNILSFDEKIFDSLRKENADYKAN